MSPLIALAARLATDTAADSHTTNQTTLIPLLAAGTALLAGAVGAWCTARITARRSAARLRAQLAELHQLAFTDPLTGLPNRRRIDDILHTAAPTRQLWVGLLDLDGFKAINTHHGYGAGDKVLTITAARLRDLLDRAATVARLGGDEFVIILPARSWTPWAVSYHILEAIAAPILIGGDPHSLTASIGWCSTGADATHDTTDVRHVLTGADIALCDAKAAGGETWVIYQPAIHGPTDHNSPVRPAARRRDRTNPTRPPSTPQGTEPRTPAGYQ